MMITEIYRGFPPPTCHFLLFDASFWVVYDRSCLCHKRMISSISGHLAALAQDLALPGRPPLQLRGRLHRGGYLHVLHRLHHLHHKTGNDGPHAEPVPG